MDRELERKVMDGPLLADADESFDHSEPNTAFVRCLLDLGATGRMLDIGTGPGEIPLLASEKMPTAMVIGIDLSRLILKIARRQLAEASADRVAFVLADAKRLPFADALRTGQRTPKNFSA